ncbi:MAG: 1-acyl-sn-glycerol-3-phosphate acyltransferase [Armatimonadetes bacterium]|nr:1-acyl-sn-glycerol-3-phosphate acyltransferase [Armatimonadota bacterium]
MALPTFYPPIEHPAALFLAKQAGLQLTRRWMRIDAIEFREPDRSRLAAALRGPVVVCPNHPSYHDIAVMLIALGTLDVLGMTMSAWEAMAFIPLWLRTLGRSVGCYSIRRGSLDREARKLTVDSLVKARALVFFPEGNVNGLNDWLEPYYPQLAWLPFEGQQARLARGLGASLMMVPAAIKYVYQQPMEAAIAASMARLEERLGLSGPAPDDRLDRLQRLFGACLDWVDRHAGGVAPAALAFDERMELLLSRVEQSCAERLGVDLPMDRPRGLRLSSLYQSYLEHATPRGVRHFPHPLPAALWSGLKRDLELLHHLHGLRDSYVAEYPSAERYSDVLGRLERVMTGEQELVGRRRVIVKIGREYWAVERGATLADRYRLMPDQLPEQLSKL